MGLSEAQMSEAVRQAKQTWTKSASDPGSSYANYEVCDTETFSLTQKINWLVYSILIGAFIYFMNRDYDGAIKILFIQYFPREAKTLGFV